MIELKVAREACSCRGDRFIGMEIHLFVFHRSPEPFNKNIIAPRASPIHTQANPVGLDESGKCVIRKLTALIRIHDVWVPIPSQGLLNSLKAELDVQRDGHAPGQDSARMPIHYRDEIRSGPRFPDSLLSEISAHH